MLSVALPALDDIPLLHLLPIRQALHWQVCAEQCLRVVQPSALLSSAGVGSVLWDGACVLAAYLGELFALMLVSRVAVSLNSQPCTGHC